MAKINKLQASISSGEISPRALGRVDVDKYQSSVSLLYNFLVSTYGCVIKRSGSKYIYNSKSNTNTSRLIPFTYAADQSYALEFNDGTLRFYRNQGIILQGRAFSNGTFTSGISGWASTSSGTGAISHDAVNQRLTLTGGGAGNEARACAESSSGIAFFGTGTYTVTLDVFTSSVTYKIGTTQNGTQIATGTLTTGTGKTFNFTPSTNTTIYIVFECAATASIDNVVLSSTPYEIITPYLLSELKDIKYEQSYDVLYLVHPNYLPRQLRRLGNDHWSLETVPFDEPPYSDPNNTTTTLTPSGTTGSITVTASSSVFANTDIGRAIRFKSGEDLTNQTTYAGNGTKLNFDIPFFPQTSTDIEVYVEASTGVKTLQTNPTNYTVSNGQVVMSVAPTSGQNLIIRPKNAGSGEWGYMTITAYTSPTQVTCTVVNTFDKAVASTFWRLGAFSATTGYPRTVCLHEQRLFFGNTTSRPQTFWASELGVYTNFAPDDVLRKGDIQADTSFSFTLGSSNSQSILWMASKGSLILGTDSGVFSINSQQGIISGLNTPNIKKELDVPCKDVRPAQTLNEVIFVEKYGQKVYSLVYSFQINGYEATDLTILADHIGLESSIEEIHYQPSSSILWCRRTDGSLTSCTYLSEQKIIGWSRHSLGGTSAAVTSLCVINGALNSEVWLNVNRSINSSSVKYIEMIEKDFVTQDKEDGKFLDCHLHYNGSATNTISGLSHLNGETVSVCVNGSSHPNVIVSGGSVTLDSNYTKVTIGFSYSGEMELNPLEGGAAIGSNLGLISKVSDISIRMYRTLGLEVGFDNTSVYVDPVYFRSTSDPMDSSPPLFTGIKQIKPDIGIQDEYKCYVKSSLPLPCTILSLALKVVVSDT